MSDLGLVAPARRSLAQWLDWQKSLHPRAIDLGLERVAEVARRLELLPFPAFCISVAGTNGKGSCALMLGHLLGQSERVGVYTSPYLLRYNERIQIDGEMVSDDDLCTAFAAVEAARAQTSLTYFEFGTLAALWLFRRAGVATAVLEVGMGGRLDAVNIVDADAAIITNIGLDHVDWLGDTREAIGREKAGILRDGQIAICADRDIPSSVLAIAQEHDIALRRIGADFDIAVQADGWLWQDWRDTKLKMPTCPALLPDNAAAVLALLTAIERLPSVAQLATLLPAYSVPGRRQLIAGNIPLLLDVAHNYEAMQQLARWLAAHPIMGEEHFVLGMLENKPVERVGPLLATLGTIYVGGLADVERGLSATDLQSRLGVPAQTFASVSQALAAARNNARAGDRVVVCGSFHTVAAAYSAGAESGQ